MGSAGRQPRSNMAMAKSRVRESVLPFIVIENLGFIGTRYKKSPLRAFCGCVQRTNNQA